MAIHNVTVKSRGSGTPPDIQPDPVGPISRKNDKIAFRAEGFDIVLCLPEAVFKRTRFEVPEGTTLTISPNPTAPLGGFAYRVECGSLDRECGSIHSEWGGGGGGTIKFP